MTAWPCRSSACRSMVRSESLSSTIRIWAGTGTAPSLASPRLAPGDDAHAGHDRNAVAVASDRGRERRLDGAPRAAHVERFRTCEDHAVRVVRWIAVAIVWIVGDPHDDVWAWHARTGCCDARQRR